jgi:3-isopropylmalate/(R)-2-methylmalate dehydratase small subunit
MLLIRLPQEQIDDLTSQAEFGSNAVFNINLERQTVTAPDGQEHHFEIDEFRKHCLLNGLDEIALTLEKESDISSYESGINDNRGWLTPAAG